MDKRNSKRLSPAQKRALARLCHFPNLLHPDAVKAFFDRSDKGIDLSYRELQNLPILARLDYTDLVMNHQHGYHSRSQDKAMIEDFRTGLLFLYDFEHEHPDNQEHVLSLYVEAFGYESTHAKQVRSWWKDGWLAGYPLGFPCPWKTEEEILLKEWTSS